MKVCTNCTKNGQVQTYIVMGPFFKEKLWKLQNDWKKEELTDFTASNRWLENWKKYTAWEKKRMCGEADKVSTTVHKLGLKRLPELCQDYEPRFNEERKEKQMWLEI